MKLSNQSDYSLLDIVFVFELSVFQRMLVYMAADTTQVKYINF